MPREKTDEPNIDGASLKSTCVFRPPDSPPPPLVFNSRVAITILSSLTPSGVTEDRRVRPAGWRLPHVGRCGWTSQKNGGRWRRSPGQPLLPRTHARSPGGWNSSRWISVKSDEVSFDVHRPRAHHLSKLREFLQRKYDLWIKFCEDEPPQTPNYTCLLQWIMTPPRISSSAGWSCASTVWCRVSDVHANLGLLHRGVKPNE